eukprot:jgi/Mesen1/9871/ME000070S09158
MKIRASPHFAREAAAGEPSPSFSRIPFQRTIAKISVSFWNDSFGSECKGHGCEAKGLGRGDVEVRLRLFFLFVALKYQFLFLFWPWPPDLAGRCDRCYSEALGRIQEEQYGGERDETGLGRGIVIYARDTAMDTSIKTWQKFVMMYTDRLAERGEKDKKSVRKRVELVTAFLLNQGFLEEWNEEEEEEGEMEGWMEGVEGGGETGEIKKE